MAIDIADLTLDEVVLHLAAGNALQVSGGADFSLPLQDSRAVLAFYNQNRQAYWNPDKDTNILDGEIDRLLDALDKLAKVTAPASRPASQTTTLATHWDYCAPFPGTSSSLRR